jgi:Domain of unknown function (DUF1707)
MAMRYYAPFSGGGGEPLRPRGPHALRIGDAERDAAAADLGEHYTAGRLNLDELKERLDAVFTAKTLGQLTRIMADLPGPGPLPWRTGPGGQADLGARRSQRAQAPHTPSDRAARFAALALLLLAMLIWLFTALLFARHGIYHQYGPYAPQGSFNHVVHSYPGFNPSQP